MSSPWTESRTDTLKILYAKGMSCSQIATELNCGFTRNAIIGRVHRMGLTLRGKNGNYHGNQHTPKPKPKQHRAHKSRERYSPESKRVMTIFESVGSINIRVVDVAPLNLTLAELDQATQCHYIAGEDLRYCAHPVQEGTSYCPAHFRLCRNEYRAPVSEKERQRRRMHFINMNRAFG